MSHISRTVSFAGGSFCGNGLEVASRCAAGEQSRYECKEDRGLHSHIPYGCGELKCSLAAPCQSNSENPRIRLTFSDHFRLAATSLGFQCTQGKGCCPLAEADPFSCVTPPLARPNPAYDSDQ